jgi:transcription elongation factor Elf1
MRVRKYVCPACGYEKAPTTHRGCPEGAGRILNVGGNWRCDACDSTVTPGSVSCSRCGESVPESHVGAVEMQL